MRAIARPTPQQAAWHDLEVGMFIHLDIPVFTDLREAEWPKAGHLDPSVFNPARLNTDQWMEVARAMGAGYCVLVAKHCSGFLLWQSDLYRYGVKQSRWRNGQGDVVRDFTDSCRRYGIRPGLYCSAAANAHLEVSDPGLVDWGKGGDGARQREYARMVEQMLAELWGNYGPLTEIWFDGGVLPPAQGGPDLVPILTRLQPDAVVFQGPAASIRWVGTEAGYAPYPAWNSVARSDAATGVATAAHGDPDGEAWLPIEVDTTNVIPTPDHAWFWSDRPGRTLKSLDELMDCYYRSVGHGAVLLLNQTPDRDGLIPEADARRAAEFGAQVRRRFDKSIAETQGHGSAVELDLGRATPIDHAIIMEQITEGERVREYVLEARIHGAWREVCRGSAIGHKKIDAFDAVVASRVQLRVTRAAADPLIRRLAVYHVGTRPPS